MLTNQVYAAWCFRMNGSWYTKNRFKLGLQRHPFLHNTYFNARSAPSFSAEVADDTVYCL
jgi:hypothetical protein